MVSESIYNAAAEGDINAKFILAHELGHLLLHKKKDFMELGGNVEMESEANEFASELVKNIQTSSKHVEQAKKMILDRYVRNKARPDDMIMMQELLSIKMECKNPKVAEAISDAIMGLVKDGLVRESGLGIHLTPKGYDLIWE